MKQRCRCSRQNAVNKDNKVSLGPLECVSSRRTTMNSGGAGGGNWAPGQRGGRQAATGRGRWSASCTRKNNALQRGRVRGRSAVDPWGRIHGRWPHLGLCYNPRPTALALHPLLSVSSASASAPRRSLPAVDGALVRPQARYTPDPSPRRVDLRGSVIVLGFVCGVVAFCCAISQGFDEIWGAARRFLACE